MRIIFFAISIAFYGIAFPSFAENARLELPNFDAYPVKRTFHGKPAIPLLDQPKAKLFRTTIRIGAALGPNFSGEHTIVTHGCGTCCKGFFIVNARTGKVHIPPFYLACHYKEGVPANGLVDLEFNINSELLIARGARNEEDGGEYYYRWHNDELELLKAIESEQLE